MRIGKIIFLGISWMFIVCKNLPLEALKVNSNEAVQQCSSAAVQQCSSAAVQQCSSANQGGLQLKFLSAKETHFSNFLQDLFSRLTYLNAALITGRLK